MRFRLSPEFCSRNSVLVISCTETEAVIGMLHPEDPVLRLRLQKTFPDRILRFDAIGEEEFKIKLARLFADTNETDTSDQSVKNGGGFAIDEISGDAPVINLLNSILLDGLSRSCSDIHIESDENGARVRFREDGILMPVMYLTDEKAAALSARLKLMANLNVLEKRRPQDGRLDIKCEGILLDARLSIIPAVWGESIVLRLLNKNDKPLILDLLGFSSEHMDIINRILKLPSGLILITGPTGSGKTTTLSAMLRLLNTADVKIISIEDPVEYRINGIVQIQTDDSIGLTFDTLLRRVFRQDPDIIMIGEIRDSQTAELAVRTALTGHLVFATLHTNSAAEASIRLRDMGIPSYLIVSVLKSVIAQRLLRRICPSCRGTEPLPGKTAACPVCRGTGYRGRTVIAEILMPDEDIGMSILSGESCRDIEKKARQKNIHSLADDAEEKIRLGITDKKEAERELGITYE